MPTDPRLETVTFEFDGLTFDGLAAGPKDGELVLCLHGWPEFADCWTEVLGALADLGYRAVAYDQRGYSPRARPLEIEHYHIEHLMSDIVHVADALGAREFHLVSHDWGAIVGWAFAMKHADRLLSFTSLAIPHLRALAEAHASDEEQRKKAAYVGFFRQPGHVAEKALLANDAAQLRAVYQGKVPQELVARNVSRLSEPGALTAVLNWYRAWNPGQYVDDVSVPVLYVWGAEDLALGKTAAYGTEAYCTGPYHFEALDDVSHWLPEEVPARVIGFLREHLAENRGVSTISS
jgi:pimeloyl-ACP methyl ester carboxylesterase